MCQSAFHGLTDPLERQLKSARRAAGGFDPGASVLSAAELRLEPSDAADQWEIERLTRPERTRVIGVPKFERESRFRTPDFLSLSATFASRAARHEPPSRRQPLAPACMFACD